MPSLSAIDALFTLHSSLDHYRVDISGVAHPDVDTANGSATASSGVTGVCFVREPTSCTSHTGRAALCNDIDREGINGESQNHGSSSEDESDEETSHDDDHPLRFRCSNLLLGPQLKDHQNTNPHNTNASQGSHQHATYLSAASRDFLSGAILASCHLDGSCKLWNLATRRCILQDICQEDPRRGSGLALRRLGTGRDDTVDKFLYQTRDPLGTVSLHDLNRPCTPILKIHTHSTSFCAMSPMSPCQIGSKPIYETAIGGTQHLLALPTEEHSVAVVRDLRCDPQSNPAWRVAIGEEYTNMMYGTRRKFGMLTSLALCLQETTQRIILGCGMENGAALFYDLGAMGQGRDPWWIGPEKNRVEKFSHTLGMRDASSEEISETDSRYWCSAKLGKDPVLCLDIASSKSLCSGAKRSSSLVAVGGCAGDADDLSELPEDEQGTLSTIKVKLADDSSAGASSITNMKSTVRARTLTCSLKSGGKVGISICRFRPDGRVFGIGGWDRRLRIYGRTSLKPIAILRGHEESVTAMDWAGNAALSGLLATGAGDGKVCIWRVFPHSLKS